MTLRGSCRRDGCAVCDEEFRACDVEHALAPADLLYRRERSHDAEAGVEGPLRSCLFRHAGAREGEDGGQQQRDRRCPLQRRVLSQ